MFDVGRSMFNAYSPPKEDSVVSFSIRLAAVQASYADRMKFSFFYELTIRSRPAVGLNSDT